ncbi:MAG: hypothetical protein KAJ31_02175 [Deltaproteobacteria bacterium]|nr:hypothetical protein [Deltaproteobacteria bacterium]
MSEKTYFFVISIPRDEIIEYTTKLNSYISKLFPEKKYPCTLKPLEIRDEDVIAKIIIKANEKHIKEFADRFFDKSYELTERENGEIEITQKEPDLSQVTEDHGLKH